MKVLPEKKTIGDTIGEEVISVEDSCSTNVDNETSKNKLLGHTLDTFSIMRKRIPNFIFSIHLLLYSNIFDEYNVQSVYLSNNTLDDDDVLVEMTEYFEIYLPLMSALCFVWEFIYCYFVIKNSKKLEKKDYIYCILNALVSLIVYIVVIFYIDSNNVLYFITNYDKKIVNVIYYFVLIIVFIISLIEKVCFNSDYILENK